MICSFVLLIAASQRVEFVVMMHTSGHSVTALWFSISRVPSELPRVCFDLFRLSHQQLHNSKLFSLMSAYQCMGVPRERVWLK